MVWSGFGRFPCHIYSSDDTACGDFGEVSKRITLVSLKKLKKAMEFSMAFSIAGALFMWSPYFGIGQMAGISVIRRLVQP